VEAAECLRLALSLCLEVLASLGAAVEGAGADVRELAEAACGRLVSGRAAACAEALLACVE